MRRLLLPLAALLPGLLLAQTPMVDPESPATPQARAQIAEDSTLAREATKRGDLEVAEKFYNQLLTVDAPDSEKKEALLDMFECYRSRQIYSKAIAVGERIHNLFPSDPETPDLLLKLGQIYRDTGAYQLAITRFYNVLNATLRIDQGEFAKYKGVSEKAQFEIAETFVTSGDYQQATRMYTMLDRLDLSPDDKAHAQFEIAYCDFLLGDYANAVSAAKHFLESFGATSYSPQCHYVLSVALNALHRPQDATDEALTLLKMEKKLEKSDAAAWIYWQKKTGNQLANQFYQEGDYLHALTIYQAMARLGDDPNWQLPVIYQIALCFEHLRFPDRATEAYKYILDQSKKAKATGKATGEDMDDLGQMAQWRSQHLEWQQNTEEQLSDLLGPKPPADDKSLEDQVKMTDTH